MKRTIFVLLSVMILVLAGCGNKKSDVAVSTETKETVAEATEETTTKHSATKEPVTESETESVTEKSDTEAPKQESLNSNDKSDNQDKKPVKEAQTVKETQPVSEPQQTAPAEPEQPQPTSRVEYSPANVVSLATAKTKAAGKVLLTENLDSMLASGQISQEEYNEYYPYDGAGYYSVFVNSNLAEARDVSGTEHFNSEDDIAQYIADMLALENGSYFLIEYAGTYDYYGKQCYEFRCYRA